MCKSDLLNEIFTLIRVETEVPKEEILSKSRTIEVVDARYLLVYFLSHYAGFSANVIAKELSITPQAVAQILRNFDLRRKQSGKFFEITFNRISNALKNNQ